MKVVNNGKIDSEALEIVIAKYVAKHPEFAKIIEDANKDPKKKKILENHFKEAWNKRVAN